MGETMAMSSWNLVYGGASVGLMGAVADAILSKGGKAYGIIPESLVVEEMAHKSLSKLEVVGGLHERKSRMYSLADAFVTLPGGIGTLDEFCETLTWAKLGYHRKPMFLLNYKGFFDCLLRQLTYMKNEKFFEETTLDLVEQVSSIDELFKKLSKS